ncbi:M23 family metallopeptidase (plasmid) [Vallitalea pronyensis]|uniref:M23 family metallopeptidase n=1 Tax=Vallitalea pronyensis TaxID=1348613 RepID=A0A8J8MQA8_9FIRM|nr:M23 family metallopeptidase [Vallitalea pronyensis]QUI25905.1 M23 family metallopeptidase [Vallitalea pronyensis]
MEQFIKRKIQMFLLKKSPYLLLIVLFIVIIIGIAEMISKIPFVGGSLNQEKIKEVQAEIGDQIGIINYDKVKKYIEIEENSYPKNQNANILVYEETLTEIAHRDDNFLLAKANHDKTENVLFRIGDTTRVYRLWWQFLAGVDVIATTSNDIKDMSVMNVVKKKLSPIFEYTFNMNNLSDFEYYQTQYSSVYTHKKTYKNGVFEGSERHQINTTKKIPLPYLKSVSTMFENKTFSYNKTIIETSEWHLTDQKAEVRYEYEQSEDGNYVYVNGNYERRTSANKNSEQGGYIEDDKGAYVKVSSYYISYNQKYHKGKQRYSYEEPTLRERYNRIKITEELYIYNRTKTEGYNIVNSSSQNTRYDEFIATHNLEDKLVEKDKELILHTGALFPESYEFSYNANTYLGHNSKLIVNGGYEGTGSYKVTDEQTKFILPIKFSENVNEKKINISSHFGPGTLTMNGITKHRFHHGTDFPIIVGTPIIAASKGKILRTGNGKIAGNYVVIKHDDGFITKYFHLNLIMCKKDQEIDTGEIIGLSGNTGYSTGPHLHFEVINPQGNHENAMIYLPLVKDD